MLLSVDSFFPLAKSSNMQGPLRDFPLESHLDTKGKLQSSLLLNLYLALCDETIPFKAINVYMNFVMKN